VAANRVFSGHCRIEAMAGDGQALLLEGLRVHLDLQLDPEAAASRPEGSLDGRRPDVAATERVAPRRAGRATQATPAYQQWAVLAALATLLLALASWWMDGEPTQPLTERTDTPSSLSAEPLGHSAAPGAPTSDAAAAPTAAAPGEPAVVVVPVLAPPAPATPGLAPSARRATVASSTPRPPPVVRARAPKTSGSAPLVAVDAERASATRQVKEPAPPPGNADLLYLFGDTK
jgi:hypothetical protein